MIRRRVALAGLVALAVSTATGQARAGSYLDRAALLLDGNRRDAEAVRSRMTDKELVAVVQQVAEARSRAAARMDVPAAVAKAHPHLLLTLSHLERAAQAALEGNYKSTVELLEGVRREETIFRAALRELGHPLPAPPSRRGPLPDAP